MPQSPSKPTLNALSGIRFFLILCVAAGHFIKPYITYWPEWTQAIVLNYYFCTSMFFILSGFILTYVYFDEEKGIRVSDKKFLFMRFVRIYPVHLLFILGMAIGFLSGPHEDIQALGLPFETKTILIGSFVSQLLMLDAWNPYFLSVNGPAWSISALFFFYLLFPGFCRLIRSFSASKLIALGAILWAAYLIFPTFYVLLGLEGQGVFYEGLLHRNPLLRLPEFLIGIVAGRLFLFYQKRNELIKLTAQISPVFILIISGLLYMLLPQVFPYALLHNGLFLPVQLFLILSLATGNDILTRFLAIPWLVRLSNASLTIFIGHYFILGWWGRVDQAVRFLVTRSGEELGHLKQLFANLLQLRFQAPDPSFASFLLSLAVLSLVSYLIQLYFVDKVSRWARNRYIVVSETKAAEELPALQPSFAPQSAVITSQITFQKSGSALPQKSAQSQSTPGEYFRGFAANR